MVQGLFEHHEYEFRVSAVNENGQGPPLPGDGPIVARMPFDPPSAPGIPDVTMVTEDFVSLSWERPKSDGGGRIMGYIIGRCFPNVTYCKDLAGTTQKTYIGISGIWAFILH